MAMTSKAALVTPEPDFGRSMTTHGVWKRKTVTSCFSGRKVVLKTAEPASRTCCCDLIRVGDEFFVAYTFGDAKRTMEGYQDIWDAVAAGSPSVRRRN